MFALVFGFVSAASTIAGGMLPLYTRIRDIGSRYLLGFAAGVMLSVAFLEMLPEIAEQGEPNFVALAAGFFSLYLVEKLVIVSDGRAEVFLGNYSHYNWNHGGGEPEEQSAPKDAMKIRDQENAAAKNDREAQRGLARQRKRLDEVERTIESMEDLLDGFDARFAELNPTEHGPLAELAREKEGIEEDLAELYAEWEELSSDPSM